jgi:ADP-ribose pyrophosphatase YjhB (NUDIX family)
VAVVSHVSPRTGMLQGRFSTGLAAGSDGVLVVPGKGLELPARLPFGRWVQVGRQLADVHSSSAWCLGDWLVYGEAAYDGRYREALEQTSLDYQTLRNYAWVARRFSFPRRQDGLSFGHHAEVAALAEAEQDFWLRKAQELGWPVKQLRSQVRRSLSERGAGRSGRPEAVSDAEHDHPGRTGARLTLELTPEQFEGFRAAAGKVDLPVERWALVTLDQAVQPGLGTGVVAAARQ